MRRGVGTAKPIDSVVKTASKNSFASPIEPIRKVLLEASERLGRRSKWIFVFPARKTTPGHCTYVRATNEMRWDIPTCHNNGLGAQAGAHPRDLP